jgi:maltooligosyltrehalose trehalohydrolase
MNYLAARPSLVSRAEEMKFGTQLTASGTRFRLWAPRCDNVSLRIIDPPQTLPMRALPRGWFELEVEGVGAGTRYYYVMPDGTNVPDPASRHQPQDVHGPSEVIDPLAFGWTDLGWRGRPWEETVLYEIHVGTFTPQGNFRAIIDKLDHIAALGVTAIELMPIADFAGRWNWGYDGVLLFAPDNSYGRPEDLKALVDAAHQRGLMVFLDVVYNHFGPEGHYMDIYAPAYTDAHHTPWGPAVNYDDDGARVIRDFVKANARYWLNEFRFDGLRFDAVHEIRDSGPRHLLLELAEQLRATTDGRHVHLVAENSANQAGWLKRNLDGSPWLYTAQWSDDIHHGLHVAATGESYWYYADFVGRFELLPRALAEGLGWQGEYMQIEGQHKGEPSGWLPPSAFVSFLQNHDQTGNRPQGDRIGALVSPEAVRMLSAIVLLCPQVPLLFMGEEWGADQPFLFFSDIQALGEAIRTARSHELRAAPGMDERAPDPMSEESFRRSTLDWSRLATEPHAGVLAHCRRLIAARFAEIVPRLHGMDGHGSRYRLVGARGFEVSWTMGDGSLLRLAANVSAEPMVEELPEAGRLIWREGTRDGGRLGPWSMEVSLEEGSGR